MTETTAIVMLMCLSLAGIYALWRAYRVSSFDLDIRSTHVKRCLDCGAPITAENDSGWQYFINGTYTQAACLTCDAKRRESLDRMLAPEIEET